MTTLCFVDTETTGLDPDRHEIWEVAIILRETSVRNVKPLPPNWVMADDIREAEFVWQLPVDLARADQIALNIGHFHERRWGVAYENIGDVGGTVEAVVDPAYIGKWAQEFARLTWGAHMIGMVPSFDTDRLHRLLRAHGACPGWHYQPIDVETLAVGAILGTAGMLNPSELVRYIDQRPTIRTGDVDHEVEEIPDRSAMARELMIKRTSLPWDSEQLSSWYGINADQYDRHSALGDARWARDLWDAIHEGATS